MKNDWQQLFEQLRIAASDYIKRQEPDQGSHLVLSDLSSTVDVIDEDSEQSFVAGGWRVDLTNGVMDKTYIRGYGEVFHAVINFEPIAYFEPKVRPVVLDVEIAVYTLLEE